MTATAALLAFTLAAAILTVTPGLDNALVLRTAAVEGGRRALLAGLGISTGCLAWGAAAAFGSDRCWPCPPSPTTCCASPRPPICSTWARGCCGTPGPDAARQARPAAPRCWRRNCPPVRLRRRRLVHARLPDQRAQSQDRRVLRHLPAAIHPAGADVMRFSLLLAAVHAVLGMLWFGLLVAATRRWRAGCRARPSCAAGPDDGRGVHRVRAEAGAGETLSRKPSMAAASASGVSFIG